MKIGIFGVSGKMGRAVASAAMDDPSIVVVSAVSRFAGQDLGEFLGRPKSGLNIEKASTALLPDVFIDFCLPQGLSERLAVGCPLVIGTTNLSESDWKLIHKTAQHIPLFWAPNFSIGMALFKRFSKELAASFPSSHIDLFETHHAKKKDAPSGSALTVAAAIRETTPTADIRIHSIRSGLIVGEHTLQFNTPEERFEITHQAHSRAAFAKGALEAARFLIRQKPGLYGMDDLP